MYNEIMKTINPYSITTHPKEHQAFEDGQKALQNKINSLFDVLAHGDEAHRNWLKSAIESHFSGNTMPKYEASINEKRIAELEQELEKLTRK